MFIDYSHLFVMINIHQGDKQKKIKEALQMEKLEQAGKKSSKQMTAVFMAAMMLTASGMVNDLSGKAYTDTMISQQNLPTSLDGAEGSWKTK